jgi:hypothetical protein
MFRVAARVTIEARVRVMIDIQNQHLSRTTYILISIILISIIANTTYYNAFFNTTSLPSLDHTNPSVYQRTRTFTNHHHPTYIHPPPTNHPTCTHRLPHSSFDIHFSTVLTSHHQVIASRPKKHEISSSNRITAKKSMKSHTQSS